ncbi:MAG: MBL fold metallo-hydrolase [Chloroflexi bacterium]|nr:MBL fold metallo-hydrolase [Chloroflexota bacterium]
MTILAEDKDIRIERLELGPFQTNCYLLICRRTGEAVVVDAPAGADRIAAGLKDAVARYILLTHNHGDHTGVLAQLRSSLKAPVAAHPAGAASLPLTPDIELQHGDSVRFGEIALQVLHTPGHTPGSLCFRTGDYLIAGDTLFPGGPGKTRSPEAFRQIIDSITTRIFTLEDDTAIYPGHGLPTTVEKAKAEFAVFSSRKHDPGLCGDVLWLSS